MKLIAIAAAAGATLLTGVAPALVAPAAAQTTVTRTVVHHDGPVVHSRRVCSTVYRHHRRIRTCRTVRR